MPKIAILLPFIFAAGPGLNSCTPKGHQQFAAEPLVCPQSQMPECPTSGNLEFQEAPARPSDHLELGGIFADPAILTQAVNLFQNHTLTLACRNASGEWRVTAEALATQLYENPQRLRAYFSPLSRLARQGSCHLRLLAKPLSGRTALTTVLKPLAAELEDGYVVLATTGELAATTESVPAVWQTNFTMSPADLQPITLNIGKLAADDFLPSAFRVKPPMILRCSGYETQISSSDITTVSNQPIMITALVAVTATAGTECQLAIASQDGTYWGAAGAIQADGTLSLSLRVLPALDAVTTAAAAILPRLMPLLFKHKFQLKAWLLPGSAAKDPSPKVPKSYLTFAPDPDSATALQVSLAPLPARLADFASQWQPSHGLRTAKSLGLQSSDHHWLLILPRDSQPALIQLGIPIHRNGTISGFHKLIFQEVKE